MAKSVVRLADAARAFMRPTSDATWACPTRRCAMDVCRSLFGTRATFGLGI